MIALASAALIGALLEGFAEEDTTMCSAWLDEDVSALHAMGATYGPAFPVNLAKLMAHESGCNPGAIDWIYGKDAEGQTTKRAGAVGLIQFEPDTLRGLGFRGDEPPGAYDVAGEDGRKQLDDRLSRTFATLSVGKQLPYVDRYLRPHASAVRVGGLGVLYTAVFLPVLVPKAVDQTYVLCGLHGPFAWAYTANATFDTEGKGYITPTDLVQAAEAFFERTPAAQNLAARLEELDGPETQPEPVTLDVTDGGADKPVYEAPPPDERRS